MQTKSFVSEKVAFEIVVENLHIAEGVFVIGS